MRKPTTPHVVTRYSMPIPGLWNYTLRCAVCKNEFTEDKEKLPTNGHCKRPCKCAEPKKGKAA